MHHHEPPPDANGPDAKKVTLRKLGAWQLGSSFEAFESQPFKL
jgi:hypothetical protein